MNTKTTNTSDLIERFNTLDNQINGARSDKKTDALEEMKYKKTFWDVVRGFAPKNALSEKLDGSGGFLVPDDFDNKLVEQLEEVNTLRRLGRCIKSGHERKIPVVSAHGTASWMDELGGIVESDEVFGNITISAYKLGTQIRISDELLEDCGLDLERYISEEFVKRIGKPRRKPLLVEMEIINPEGSSLMPCREPSQLRLV